MAGTLSLADLIADLKAMLMDAANKFTAASDADFERHLTLAALDLARKRPRTMLGEITALADVSDYTAPADMRMVKNALWGVNEQRHRWRSSFPGMLPRPSYVGGMLHLMPAPTAEQIAQLGSSYKFYYFANYVIGADAANTTINAGDRHLLLIRAAAQAMQELAANNYTKPVQLGSGSGGVSMPKNGTAASLAGQLLQLFEVMS
jgi:hypothetical protein